MKLFRNPVPAAHLWKITQYRVICMNATRWSSTYMMISRFKQINKFLPDVELPNRYSIEEYLPNHRKNKQIEKIFDLCGYVDSIAKMLQRKKNNIA